MAEPTAVTAWHNGVSDRFPFVAALCVVQHKSLQQDSLLTWHSEPELFSIHSIRSFSSTIPNMSSFPVVTEWCQHFATNRLNLRSTSRHPQGGGRELEPKKVLNEFQNEGDIPLSEILALEYAGKWRGRHD